MRAECTRAFDAVTGMQIEDLEADHPDVTLPYSVPFPDLPNEKVPTANAIALTGARMMTSFLRTRASPATLGSGPAVPAHRCPPGNGVDDVASGQRSPTSKRQRTHAPLATLQRAIDSDTTARTGSEAAIEQPHGALAGGRQLAAVMRLEAPARLTLQSAYDLFEACSVLLANEVISNSPAYVAPALADALLIEVRLRWTRLCLASWTLFLVQFRVTTSHPHKASAADR